MTLETINNHTIFELVGVTLFSFYSEICFSFWMPAMCDFPHWFHLLAQFLFIGIPQAAIIIIPQHMSHFYFSFGIFGIIGLFLSFMR